MRMGQLRVQPVPRTESIPDSHVRLPDMRVAAASLPRPLSLQPRQAFRQ